jgi:hypothetical protein
MPDLVAAGLAVAVALAAAVAGGLLLELQVWADRPDAEA